MRRAATNETLSGSRPLADLDEQGVVLVTGKSKERTPVPFGAHVTPAAHLLFGTDDEEIDLTTATHVHRGWREVETGARGITPLETASSPVARDGPSS